MSKYWLIAVTVTPRLTRSGWVNNLELNTIPTEEDLVGMFPQLKDAAETVFYWGIDVNYFELYVFDYELYESAQACGARLDDQQGIVAEFNTNKYCERDADAGNMFSGWGPTLLKPIARWEVSADKAVDVTNEPVKRYLSR